MLNNRLKISALTFVVVVAHSRAAEPSELLAKCRDRFGAIAAQLSRPFKRSDAIFAGSPSTSDPLQRLKTPVRAWLNLQKDFFAVQPMSKEIGTFVSVGGVRAMVVAKIGRGDEGEVYLVETAHGFRTLKIFFDAAKMQKNLADLAAPYPLAAPKIFERNSNAVIFEYIEGVNVADIKLNILGLPDEESKAIMTAWELEQRKIEAEGYKSPLLYNVVYSFRDRHFYRIDPE